MRLFICKILAILSVCVMALSVYPAQSIAASPIKPGTACKPLGTQKVVGQLRYTCTKSGKKLIWSKPSPVVVDPFQGLKPITPWQTDINSSTLGDAVQFQLRKWILTQSNAKLNHSFVVDGNPESTSLAVIQKGDEFVSKLFSQYFPNGSTTIVSKDADWIFSEAQKRNLTIVEGARGACRSYTSNFTYCINNENLVGFKVSGPISIDRRNIGMATLPMHEYFHNVQAAIGKTPQNPMNAWAGSQGNEFFPIWWTEGTAEVVGYGLYAEMTGMSYSSIKGSMMSAPPGLAYPNSNALKDYTIRVGQGNGDVLYPYNVGRIAAEWLIASKGFETVLELYKEYASSRNFYQSFEKVYGITTDDYYKRFEEVRTKIGLPPVTMKWDGAANVPINK